MKTDKSKDEIKTKILADIIDSIKLHAPDTLSLSADDIRKHNQGYELADVTKAVKALIVERILEQRGNMFTLIGAEYDALRDTLPELEQVVGYMAYPSPDKRVVIGAYVVKYPTDVLGAYNEGNKGIEDEASAAYRMGIMYEVAGQQTGAFLGSILIELNENVPQFVVYDRTHKILKGVSDLNAAIAWLLG